MQYARKQSIRPRNNFVLFSIVQRVPKLQAEDQAIWWDTLNKMQKLLRKAAASLHAAGKFEKDLMHNYFMSGKISSAFIELILQ